MNYGDPGLTIILLYIQKPGCFQEQPDKISEVKKLDDDQDRQNPAYVPRKGAFFEHDLRLETDSDENDKSEQKKDAKRYRCNDSLFDIYYLNLQRSTFTIFSV